MRFDVVVEVGLKPGVLDPQGQAVQAALHTLGYPAVDDVAVGKIIRFSLAATDRQQAEEQVAAMCRQLLANPVMEQFTYRVSHRLAGRTSDPEALGVEEA